MGVNALGASLVHFPAALDEKANEEFDRWYYNEVLPEYAKHNPEKAAEYMSNRKGRGYETKNL